MRTYRRLADSALVSTGLSFSSAGAELRATADAFADRSTHMAPNMLVSRSTKSPRFATRSLPPRCSRTGSYERVRYRQ